MSGLVVHERHRKQGDSEEAATVIILRPGELDFIAATPGDGGAVISVGHVARVKNLRTGFDAFCTTAAFGGVAGVVSGGGGDPVMGMSKVNEGGCEGENEEARHGFRGV